MLTIIDKGKQDLQNKISESIVSKNLNALQSLEFENERMLRLLLEFVLDKDLLELAASGDQMDGYEKIDKIKQIQRRLHLIKQSSPFIAEVKTYVPSIDRTILSTEFLTSVPVTEMAAMTKVSPEHEGSWKFWDERVWIRFYYGGTKNSEPLFVQSIELALPQLHQTLLNVHGEMGGTAAFIHAFEGWSISIEDDPELTGWLSAYLQSRQEEAGIESVTYQDEPYWVAYRYSPSIGIFLVDFVPERSILGEMKKYEARLWMLFLASLALIVLFSYSIYRIIHRPLRKLLLQFRSTRHGHLQPMELPSHEDEFAYLYKGFNDMVERLQELISEVYQQKIISQRHELKRLQSQINPHFLYNCLFVLNQLILSGDMETAYRFSLSIGQYFQFMTKDGADEIPLELELAHSCTYVEIQKICFADRVEVCFSDSVPCSQPVTVPRLILQPVIENSYKYAFGNKRSGGRLRIHSATEGTFLSIVVEDNGDQLSDDEIVNLSERITGFPAENEDISGLHNVHRRIQLKFGQRSGLVLSRSHMGGLQVKLLLECKP